MKNLIIALSIIVLSGCGTVNPNVASDNNIRANKNTCSQYGLKFGTLPFAQCMASLGQEQRHRFESRIKLLKRNNPIIVPGLNRPIPCALGGTCVIHR